MSRLALNRFALLFFHHDADFQIAIVLVSMAVAVKLGARRSIISGLLITMTLASVGYPVYVLNRYYPSSPNLFAYVPPSPALPTPSVSYFDAYYGRPWTRWPAAAIGALTFLLHAKMQRELGTGVLSASSSSPGTLASTQGGLYSQGATAVAQLQVAPPACKALTIKSTSYGTGTLNFSRSSTGSEAGIFAPVPSPVLHLQLQFPSALSRTSRVARALVLRWWPATVAAAIGVMLTLISVTMTADIAPGWPRALTVAFNACSKPLFITAAAAVLLVTLHHREASYNRLLGHGLFQVLGKLTFGLYLTHIPVIMTFTGSVTAFQRLTPALVLQTFCGAYAASLALAALLYVTVELPAANLVKTCVSRTRSAPSAAT